MRDWIFDFPTRVISVADMRKSNGCLAILVAGSNLFVAALAPAQTLGFQRDTQVGVLNVPEKKDQKLVLFNGMDSCVSPDGKSIAFTESLEDGGRFITVGDAVTGKKRRLADIPGDNSYRPLWSPDGRTLTFDHFLKDDWVVGQVNVDGSGFRILKGLPRKVSSHAWSPDGKRLLCQDMEGLFWVDVTDWDKPVVKDIPQPDKLEGLSSATSMAISPDGKSALLTMEVPPEGEQEFPPTAIFLIELDTGVVTRLSAKGAEASDPSWLPDGKNYVFSLYGEVPGIHVAEPKPGAISKRLIENATDPSVAHDAP